MEDQQTWQGFEGDFFAVFTLPERCSTGNPLDTEPSLWSAGEHWQPSISSAIEEGLSILSHPEKSGWTHIVYKSQPHERIESVSRLRKKSGESESDFIYRVSQYGEDDSYFAARATRAELQAESAFDHGWLVEEEGEEV